MPGKVLAVQPFISESLLAAGGGCCTAAAFARPKCLQGQNLARPVSHRRCAYGAGARLNLEQNRRDASECGIIRAEKGTNESQ